MAPDDPTGTRPPPVVLRIKLRYPDVDALVQRFAVNVGKSGLFLPTRSVQAVGREIKFELRLADDKPVLVGLGRVTAARPLDPSQPRAAYGMAIELMRVTRDSRDVILRMLERRRELGLPELGIPMPDDIDAARRSEVMETGVKDTTVGAVPTEHSAVDSAPVLATPPLQRESGSMMTAPRRTTGPVAVQKVHALAPLAPERPRKPRVSVQEVIERASGPTMTAAAGFPELDADVDVAAVLARARALAGEQLDDELEALREAVAVPIEISIEAASAELARQLGGASIRRDRSARWETPPTTVRRDEPSSSAVRDEAATTVSADGGSALPEVAALDPDEHGFAVDDRAASSDGPIGVAIVGPLAQLARDQEATSNAAAVTDPADAVTDPPIEDEASSSETPGEANDRALEAAALRDSTPVLDLEPDPEPEQEPDPEPEPEVLAVQPEQIADEIHQLVEADYEEVEATAIGAMPQPEAALELAFDPALELALDRALEPSLGTQPGVAAELERSIDQHLAEAEADDFDLVAAAFGDQAVNQAYDASDPDEEPIEEVEDFEILAVADAEDEDLLSSHGEADASGGHVPAVAAAPLLDDDPAAEFADEYASYPGEALATLEQHPVEPEPAAASSAAPDEPYDAEPAAVAEEPIAVAMPPMARASVTAAPVAEPARTPRRPSAPVVERAEPTPRPSELDFMNRLDFSDQFEAISEATPSPSGRADSFSELDAALGDLDGRGSSAALASFDDDDDDGGRFGDRAAYQPPDPIDYNQDSQYTVAGDLPMPTIDFGDAPSSDPERRDPAPPRAPSPRVTAPPPAPDGYDLETALDALDVDLDDLSLPHAPTALANRPPPVQPKPIVRPGLVRAATDIPIDYDEFDDD